MDVCRLERRGNSPGGGPTTFEDERGAREASSGTGRSFKRGRRGAGRGTGPGENILQGGREGCKAMDRRLQVWKEAINEKGCLSQTPRDVEDRKGPDPSRGGSGVHCRAQCGGPRSRPGSPEPARQKHRASAPPYHVCKKRAIKPKGSECLGDPDERRSACPKGVIGSQQQNLLQPRPRQRNQQSCADSTRLLNGVAYYHTVHSFHLLQCIIQNITVTLALLHVTVVPCPDQAVPAADYVWLLERPRVT
eukprot:scaffold5_cov331-Pavlova_lutheri.AAC.23